MRSRAGPRPGEERREAPGRQGAGVVAGRGRAGAAWWQQRLVGWAWGRGSTLSGLHGK